MKGNKKAVLLSCFNYYDIRMKFVERFFGDAGYEVTYLISDFDHISKSPFAVERPGTILVNATPYQKNLSVQRMRSHFVWAKDVFREVEKLRPDLLYVMLPPNSLARHAARYRRRNKTSKLVFDIYDLWPETYPLSQNALFKVPFGIWRRMRDRYLGASDLIITECDLFQQRLINVLGSHPTETMYPALEDVLLNFRIVWDEEQVHLAYLGSINNIIDIPLIADLIRCISKFKKVTLHIIGSGESKENFVRAAGNAGATIIDHGAIYDSDEKQLILNQCRFGLNIMKETVCVGLTMKSLDYFRAGIPIISNIKHDTKHIIEDNQAGYHLGHGETNAIANEIISLTRANRLAMGNNARTVFVSKFSKAAIELRLAKLLLKLEFLNEK